MGSTIRTTAAVPDIFEDLDTSFTNAKARGGKALLLAEECLTPVRTIAGNITGQTKTVKTSAATVLAALKVADGDADDLFHKVADDVWNATGRPAADPYLSILLPGGSSFYVDGDVTEQPDKMLLFVGLMRAQIHPKLDKAVSDGFADTVEKSANELRAAVTAAQGPRTTLQLLERTYIALARVAALQIAAYKRLLKANGFSEVDVHTIIPDRPR